MTDETIKTEITENDVAGHGLHTGAQGVRNQAPVFDTTDDDEEVTGHRFRDEVRAADDDDDDDVEGHRLHHGHH
jgi:hypothetical protein